MRSISSHLLCLTLGQAPGLGQTAVISQPLSHSDALCYYSRCSPLRTVRHTTACRPRVPNPYRDGEGRRSDCGLGRGGVRVGVGRNSDEISIIGGRSTCREGVERCISPLLYSAAGPPSPMVSGSATDGHRLGHVTEVVSPAQARIRRTLPVYRLRFAPPRACDWSSGKIHLFRDRQNLGSSSVGAP